MPPLFSLSAKGLTFIPVHNYHVIDFTFIVGGTSYYTTNLVADFLSLKIARLHATTPTLSSFTLDTPDHQKDFTHFLSLARGTAIDLTEANYDIFWTFATTFENPELFQCLMELRPESPTVATALERLSATARMSIPHSEVLEFVAAHLFEFTPSALAALEPEVLAEVLRKRVRDGDREDDLLGLIEVAARADRRHFDCVQFVAFERLSIASVSKFVALAEDLNMPVAPGSPVWRAICRRLLADGAKLEPAVPRPEGQVVEFVPSQPLFGMVAFLSQKCGGNVHRMGVVKVTASSYYSVRFPENVVDLAANSYFYSEDQPNQWLCLDFQKATVIATRYSIQTRQYGGDCHIRTWVVEGSAVEDEWVELDSQVDVDGLDGLAKVGSFEIAKRVQCRKVRIRQTGPNSAGNNHLSLGRFELFGEIQE
jgi:hypothetical protein